MSGGTTEYTTKTNVVRSMSAPVNLDRGLPASRFPPVLVMYHPTMETLAKNLVKRVNETNQVTENGEVTAM